MRARHAIEFNEYEQEKKKELQLKKLQNEMVTKYADDNNGRTIRATFIS